MRRNGKHEKRSPGRQSRVRAFTLLPGLLLLLCCLCGCASLPAEGGTADPGTETSQREPAAEPERPAGEKEPVPDPETEPNPVRISEVMSSNKATLADRNGNFGDWVELVNPSAEAAELTGCILRCGGDRWHFPELTLPAGAYLLVFCDRTAAAEPTAGIEGEAACSDPSGELHTDFAISSAGEEIRFYSASGELLDLFPALQIPEDCSAVRPGGESAAEAAEPVISQWPTPGYENTEAGWEAFQLSRTPGADAPRISEVMTSNPDDSASAGFDGDWVELFNPTDRTLDLGEYRISDREKDRLLARLPSVPLAPGEYIVLPCSEEETGGDRIPFALNAEKDELYLSLADGTLCDYVSLRAVPSGCSIGRQGESGFYYYALPSPMTANSGGVRFTGSTPVLLGEDGVFNGVTEVVAELSGPGTIRYTLDGSAPTEASPVWTGPLTLRGTTVIRAACFEDNHLPGGVLSLSFILNEGHEIPVVSLVCDPDAMLDNPGGVYYSPDKDLEIPGAVMFYEDGSLFRHDCGVKLHGATSKFVQEKKSLKLNFRKRYGGALQYPVFDSDVTEFSSLLLRTAQEGQSSSYMRDALMHELAKECFPELPSQDHRYAALYINGLYWGLYNIREAHSEEHYANHYGYHPDTVIQWHEKWDKTSIVEEIYDYALSHDLSVQENFDYVAEHLNIDSVIAWLILQDYCGNMDFNSPNMRFYWSGEDEQLRYALVDLDLGLFTAGNLPSLTYRGYYAYNKLAGALIKNEGFRRDFCLRLNEVLSGPMSDENVLLLIDRFAGEMQPEIEREKERWGGKVVHWEHLVDEIRNFITKKDGQAKNMVRLLVSSGAIRSTEADEYLADFVIHRTK